LYRTLAQRWTRVLVALFAVGVVTGTILSFEMGLLWPAFTGTFGGVFGLGFAVEGFLFFAEAIFIGIYVYGWDRLSPRAHFAADIPIAIAGFTGSLTVISVNGWMNHPTGFTLRGGQVVDVHPVEDSVRGHDRTVRREERSNGPVASGTVASVEPDPIAGPDRGESHRAEAGRRSRCYAELVGRPATADGVARSVCPYSAVACGQRSQAQDGKSTQIEGDLDSPIPRGRMCPKGAAAESAPRVLP
jgi:bd-type cytochrome oxidase subunit I/molybdopterin-dependent oxidoreductase iron-sulfur protein